MSPPQGNLVDRVALEGFCGHQLAVRLGRITVLAGPNGSGKSSVLDALALATTGQLPRAPVEDGLAAVGALRDCTPSVGAFSVSVFAGEQQATFRFSAGERGRRSIEASWTGNSRRNEDHLAAIRDRWGSGTPALLSVDVGALRNAGPKELRRAILEICGVIGEGWASQRVIGELVGRLSAEHAALLRTELVGVELSSQPAKRGPGRPRKSHEAPPTDGAAAATTDPAECAAAAFEAVGTAIAVRLSAARSLVRSRSAEEALELPTAPPEGELMAAKERMEGLETRLREAQNVVALENQRIDQMRTAHALAVKAAAAARAAANRRVEEEASGVRTAQRRLNETRAVLMDLQVQRIDATHPPLPEEPSITAEGFLADESGVTEIRELRAELAKSHAAAAAERARWEREPLAEYVDDGPLRQVANTTHDLHAQAIDRARRAEMELVAARKAYHALDGRAICPLCGQPAAEAAQASAANYKAAEAALATAAQEAKEFGVAAEAARRVVREAGEQNDARHSEAERRERAIFLVDAGIMQLDALLLSARKLAAANARAAYERDCARRQLLANGQGQRLATLEAQVGEQEIAARAAEGRLAEAQAQAAAVENDARARTAEAERDVKSTEGSRNFLPETYSIEQNLRQARTAYHSILAAQQIRADALRRHGEAAERRAEAQALCASWDAIRRELYLFEEATFESFVGPLVGPVNALLKSVRLGGILGTFRVVFGERFEVGFQRPEGFAPLARLSDGHFAMAMILLMVAVHRLGKSKWRCVALDGAECLDSHNRPLVLRLLSALVARDHLDQALLAVVDGYGWGEDGGSEDPNRIMVADLRTAVTAAGEK